MVTLRGILLCAVATLALLGACRDVPVDPDTGRVVPDTTKDTTHTPGSRDTCKDCLPSRERIGSHRMWFVYKRDGGWGRFDTVEFAVPHDDVKRTFSRNGDGSASLGLRLEVECPPLPASLPEYWGIRKFMLNIPSAVIDAQGVGKRVELDSDPYQDDDGAGLGVLYRYSWQYGSQSGRETEIFATGDVVPGRGTSSGSFRITHVDPLGRFVDAHLEARIFFPEKVRQPVGSNQNLVEIKDLSFVGVDVRIALR